MLQNSKKERYSITVSFLIFILFFLILIPEFFAFIPGYGFFVKPLIFLTILILMIKGWDRNTIEKFKNLRILIIIFIYEMICQLIYYQKAGFGFGVTIRSFITDTYPFLFAVLVALYIKNYKNLKQITYILMIPIIIQIILGLIQLLYGSNEVILKLLPFAQEGVGETFVSTRNILGEMSGIGSKSLHIMGTFGHFNRYGYFLMFAPIVLLAQRDTENIIYKKAYLFILFLLSMTSLYFSYSRGALLPIIIFLVIYFYKFKLQISSRRILLIFLIILFSIFFIHTLYKYISEYYLRTQHLTGRVDIWTYFYNYILNFKFIDLIFGSHTYLLDVQDRLWMGAHNSYLMIIYDKGLIGFMFYIILIIKIVLSKYNNKDSNSNYLIFIALKYTVFAFLIGQFFDHKLFLNILHRAYFFTFAAIILTSSKFLNSNNYGSNSENTIKNNEVSVL